MTLPYARSPIAQHPSAASAHAFVGYEWDTTRSGALYLACSCGWRSGSTVNTLPHVLTAWTEHLSFDNALEPGITAS